MKIIGITGGIGSGKSTVADLLRKRGWIVYSSDEISKELMQTDVELKTAIVELLGAGVEKDGLLDTDAIAALVFGNSVQHRNRLHALNRLVHPRVLAKHMMNIERHRELGSPLIAIETALLFEVGLQHGFDYVIVVDAPKQVCIDRVVARSGATAADVEARMAEQMNQQDKKGLADFVIDNSSTLEALTKTVNSTAGIVEVMPERPPQSDDDDFESEFEDGYDEDDFEPEEDGENLKI
ncbi:MAG: dephospho-CoA kinase [Ignavibacteria bacterium]|nr:dephospho-CoA kinase [Ignavibacteria bacterium]